MNNQWGRSGNGSATGGGSGIGGILFASVVCLVLGAAGGYGAFRMLGGAPPADEIGQRDRRIAELARELDTRVAEVEAGSEKARALTAENGALTRQIEALRKNAGASDATAAIAENAKLTQDIVPGLKNELQLAGQRVADAEALKKRAEEAVRDRERQLSVRADQIARLETALDQARSQKDTAQNAETERLEAEADTLRRQLEEAQRDAETIRTKDLPALQAELARKDSEIAALNTRNAALAARIDALETARANGEAGNAGTPALDNTKPADSRSPRNAALVADAMNDTPGLDRLTSGQRDQLERVLVSGECVTNALGAVFKRVPVLTLRNLMRDLDSDC
jgi:hypothetical protein